MPVVTNYLPKRYEKFLALALLGEKGNADEYYPNNDMNIDIGEKVRWNIYVYNHMGESKYIAIRVKLVNSKLSPPNSTSCSPTPSQIDYEIRHVLLNNETWQHPFEWVILNIKQSNDSISITRLKVNSEFLNVDVNGNIGESFRLIFELWVYDEESEDFQFGWVLDQKKSRCAWNQVWFNVLTE